MLDDIDFGDDDLPRPGKVWEDSGPSLSELVKGQSAGTPPVRHEAQASPSESGSPVPSQGNESIDVAAIWSVALADLKNSQPGLYGVASNGRLDRIDDDTAILRIPASIETFARAWDKSGKKDAIRDAVIRALGRPVGLKFEVDDGTGESKVHSAAANGTAESSATSPNGGSAKLEATRPGPTSARPPMSRPPPPPPPAMAQRVTQEQADSVRQQSPLVEALVSKLNAQIVKIESPT